MPTKVAYAIIFLAFMSLACGPTSPKVRQTVWGLARDGQLQVELLEHQQHWMAANIKNYRYTVYQSCIGPNYCYKPHVVEVRDGVVVSVTDERNGTQVNRLGFSTIDHLFVIIQEAIWNNYPEVAISYDTNFGYPIRIWIDPKEEVTYEEVSLDVTDFEVIKNGD